MLSNSLAHTRTLSNKLMVATRGYKVTRARVINHDYDNEWAKYKQEVKDVRKKHWNDYWLV